MTAETTESTDARWWCLRCEDIQHERRCPKCGLTQAEQYRAPIPYTETDRPPDPKD